MDIALWVLFAIWGSILAIAVRAVYRVAPPSDLIRAIKELLDI